jgi:hypothetical protein
MIGSAYLALEDQKCRVFQISRRSRSLGPGWQPCTAHNKTSLGPIEADHVAAKVGEFQKEEVGLLWEEEHRV